MSSDIDSVYNHDEISHTSVEEHLLTELEEVIGLRGKLRCNSTSGAQCAGSRPLALINERYGAEYGVHFHRIKPALAFMEKRIAEAKKRVRERVEKYKEVAA